MTLRTANGIILRVAVFSLGTHTVSFFPVPEVRDQSINPGRESFHQQDQEHQWQQQARHGGEAHVRPAVTSHSPIRTQAVAAAGAVAAKESRDERVRRSKVELRPWVGALRVETGMEITAWSQRPQTPKARTRA